MMVEAWERQEDETNRAWAAFVVYRDMGSDRTVLSAVAALGHPPGYRKRMEEWSVKYRWVQRCRDYDNYLDRKHRAGIEQIKREEYLKDLEKFRSDEKIRNRTMFSITARCMQVIQYELERRLRQPEGMKIGEMASLLKAIIAGNEAAKLSTRLILEAESLNHISSIDAEMNEELSFGSAEELAREYRRLIDDEE